MSVPLRRGRDALHRLRGDSAFLDRNGLSDYCSSAGGRSEGRICRSTIVRLLAALKFWKPQHDAVNAELGAIIQHAKTLIERIERLQGRGSQS